MNGVQLLIRNKGHGRSLEVPAVTIAVALVLGFLSAGCRQKILMHPGRDAIYQVTTQTTPAYSPGNQSQSAVAGTTSVGDSYVSTQRGSLF